LYQSFSEFQQMLKQGILMKLKLKIGWLKILQKTIAPDILPVHPQFFPDFDGFFAEGDSGVMIFFV